MGRKIKASMILVLATTFFADPGGAAQDQSPVYNLDGFYAQFEDYLARFHDPDYPYDPRDLRGNFSVEPASERSLYGSTDAVYVLYTLGELHDRTTAAGRAEWAAYINSCQDARTGWYTRNRDLDRLYTSPFKEHSTAYAISALKMLGHEPAHPLRAALRIARDRRTTELWLEGAVLWVYVWGGSHQVGGLGSALEMTGEAADEWFDWYFDWLDKEVNPETGLWQRAPWNALYDQPTMQEMGGAPHMWWVYHHRGRPLPHPRKIIDTCLALQRADGFWDDKGYTYCVDLDALWGIHRAYLQLRAEGVEYRTEDVRRCFERYLAAATALLNEPGSLERHYTNAHALPGALIALSEAQLFFHQTLGEHKLDTPRPLRQALDVVSWI